MNGGRIRTRQGEVVSGVLRLGALVVALGLLSVGPVLAGSGPLGVKQNAPSVPAYDVFELAFTDQPGREVGVYEAEITVTFTSPTGKSLTVGGFYFGKDTWKARLAPDAVGTWSYRYTFRAPWRAEQKGNGSFTCVAGNTPGFVRSNPKNPFTWVFDNGTPYWPMGLQDCIGAGGGGDPFAKWAIDGGDRNGPWNAEGTDADAYLATYAQAGFNLFRFSQDNCSYTMANGSTGYDKIGLQAAKWTDELLVKVRGHGYRVFYGFIGYADAYINKPDEAAKMAEVKRFLKYSVDRWGVYVDFWELLNEQHADPRWTTMMADYVHSIDPYHHPLTDWEQETLPAIDFNSPHWYEREPRESSDIITAENARKWKALGKPVVVGEQGNLESVWDYTSAQRMRFRTWSALFNEISFVFWNTSYALNGHNMNQYLGPEERQYICALQNFTRYLDSGMKSVPVTSSHPKLQAHGLASEDRAALYLHKRSGYLVGAKVATTIPKAGTGYWLAPKDLQLLGSFPVAAGEQSISVPNFDDDLVLLVAPGPIPSGPPTPVMEASPRFGIGSQPVALDGRKSAGAFGKAIVSYEWSLGDDETATGPVVKHTYEPGNYLVTLTVTDAAGAKASASMVVRVATGMAVATNVAAMVTITAEPSSGTAPLTVQFHTRLSGFSSAPGYEWDFGDMGTAQTAEPTHTFARTGTFPVTVIVQGKDGERASAYAIVTVLEK